MPTQTIAENKLEQDFINNTITINPVPFAPKREVSAFGIMIKLQEQNVSITTAKAIQYGQQIRLTCGAIINVFDNGTVFVQGKLNKYTRAITMKLLKKVLPQNTRWGL